MGPQDFSIALRVRHPSIDPAEVTSKLGIEPQHAWRAGEPRRMDDDDAGSAVHRDTYWLGLLPPPRFGPALALGHLAERVEEGLRSAADHPQISLYFTLLKMKRSTAVWREFAEQGGTVECLLQVHKADRFQLDLSQALLLALVDLRITLSIEVEGALRAAA
jgi:hypothetical protein